MQKGDCATLFLRMSQKYQPGSETWEVLTAIIFSYVFLSFHKTDVVSLCFLQLILIKTFIHIVFLETRSF